MEQVTVKPGDTVSAIAARFGVPISAVTGYRSGNANLIYPNEVLTINKPAAATTVPAATTSVPSYTSPTAPPPPVKKSYEEIYRTASSLIPEVDTSGLEADKARIAENAQKSAEATRAMAPTVQNIYTTLAAQLEKSQANETERLKTKETQDQASTAQSAAISGFETGSGYEAGIARAITKDYTSQITSVADNYGLKFDQLKNEEVKDLQTLEKEAQAAIAAGDEKLGAINMNILGLKQQQSALVRQAASDIQSAQNAEEQNYYTKLYQDAMTQLKARELDLTAEKIKSDERIAAIKLSDANAPKYTANDVEQIAASVLNGVIPGTSIPKEIQGSVSQRINEALAAKKEPNILQKIGSFLFGG